MIRIDAVWLSVEPLDMRAGTEAALTRVVNVFGAARPHDGIGVWLAARSVNAGRFVWPSDVTGTLSLSRSVRCPGAGPPWRHIG